MRATTVTAADFWLAGGHRHVQPIAAPAAATSAATRTARPVPRAAGRHGATRQPGLDGLSVLLAGEVAARCADRLPGGRHHHPRGRHAGTRHRHDMGCRHPDMGRLADRGSPRRGHPDLAADAGASLRDPALHRARYVAARLPAPQGRARPAAIDHGGHVHPRNHGTATAPLLVDQRVEGTGRCQRHTAGHRADPAGLVLRGRGGRGPGADHRPDVLPAHWWHRAVAVPPGAQARRTTGTRLAIRFPAPVPQVGQRGAFLRLRRRPARAGGAAVAARLRPGHRADAWRENRTADLPACRPRHGDNCGKTC